MLIYEKDSALKFILEQGAQENLDLSSPDITLTKESGKVEILIGATAGTWIYTVSDDNDSVDVTFTVTSATEP